MSRRSRSYRKNLEFIANDIGEDLIPFLSKEKILEHITTEDIVRSLTPEERKKLRQLLEDEDEKNQR